MRKYQSLPKLTTSYLELHHRIKLPSIPERCMRHPDNCFNCQVSDMFKFLNCSSSGLSLPVPMHNQGKALISPLAQKCPQRDILKPPRYRKQEARKISRGKFQRPIKEQMQQHVCWEPAAFWVEPGTQTGSNSLLVEGLPDHLQVLGLKTWTTHYASLLLFSPSLINRG